MKTTLLLSFGLISIFSNSQQIIDKCLSHKAIQYQESLTPGYINQVNAVFENAKAHQSKQRVFFPEWIKNIVINEFKNPLYIGEVDCCE